MMKVGYIGGIDIGSHGCLSIIDSVTLTVESVKLYIEEDIASIYDVLSRYKNNLIVCIETPETFSPGVQAIKSLAVTFGVYIAYLELLNIPYVKVSPCKNRKNYWKKEFNLDKDKNKSIQAVLDIMPQVDKFIKKEKPIKPRGGRKLELVDIYDDNVAEAFLIALFLKRKIDENSIEIEV